MNVTGWRAEPEHVQSDYTTRLLRWMTALSVPALSIEMAADQVARGFVDLVDASSVAVWARRTENEDLCFVSMVGEGSGAATGLEDEELPLVGTSATSLPTAPLWLEDAAGASRALADRLAQYSGRTDEDGPSLLLALRSVNSRSENVVLGVALLWLDSPDGLLSEGLQPLLEASSRQAGQLLAGAARAEKQASSFHQLAEAFAGAIDARDARRAGHSTAVAYYAELIARAMELEQDEVEAVEFAALLHDLGRISVPDAILQKSEPLTPSELEVVRSAPREGAELLGRVNGLQEIAAIVRHQNEKWSGAGTPDGLIGDEIPLGSRIIALATRFAAMTAARADRRPLSVVGGAMEAVVEESGKSLDPRVVEAFLRAMGRSL